MPALIVGQPVRTAGRNLQLYLIFPLSAEQRTLALIQSTLALAGLALLGLLAGISSIVTRQVVRPVRQAADVAERFADGHLDERMPVYGDDEVARLAESYNEMAASIQQQIHQLEEFGALQRRFTSDVSHELRTPLTTVRMAAEVLHAQAEDLDPIARRLVAAARRRARPVRVAARRPAGDQPPRRGGGRAGRSSGSTCGTIVRRSAETVRHLVEDTATPLLLDLAEPAEAEVDPRRVERILRNLLANAIDHGESRPIEVRVAADEHAVAVVVRDHGLGLKPGEAGLVFNRFWRADPSRQRRSGGTGLGSRDQPRGRPAAGRLAAGLGRDRPRRGVPADPAAHRGRAAAHQPAAADPGHRGARRGRAGHPATPRSPPGTALPPPTGEIPTVRTADDDEAGPGDDGPPPPGADRPERSRGAGRRGEARCPRQRWPIADI